MAKIKVFLDTNVLIKLLSGQKELLQLFSEEVVSKVSYVTSPIAFQELLLLAERATEKMNWGVLQQHVELLPIDFEKVDSVLRDELRRFRNLAVHSNDVLIVGTAEGAKCDYLLTYDKDLVRAVDEKILVALTPEEFLASLRKKR
jgi:predicted nucleic acid-binding protein